MVAHNVDFSPEEYGTTMSHRQISRQSARREPHHSRIIEATAPTSFSRIFANAGREGRQGPLQLRKSPPPSPGRLPTTRVAMPASATDSVSIAPVRHSAAPMS
ncbi:hypothetical protein J7T55_007770 [Diaporthe amygdali]|uniref:uncharacterized protein n=1 Tax=Phomopsis amygdali TaxID=1214568 RepID=UPI0022FE1B51|nr:uncharacterized protein J7T55_007770 [Diaporthe amygdali]KAJ0107580.1 hypothetical protein J7T55_007770 [Diaporthe amygdali]